MPDTLWDQARKRQLTRTDPMGKTNKLDRDVNYFILKLESLGHQTWYSCGGHPLGFYVMFQAPYKQAMNIVRCGFFTVEICGDPHAHMQLIRYWPHHMDVFNQRMRAAPDWWVMRLGAHNEIKSERTKRQALRWAADSWEEKLQVANFSHPGASHEL